MFLLVCVCVCTHRYIIYIFLYYSCFLLDLYFLFPCICLISHLIRIIDRALNHQQTVHYAMESRNRRGYQIFQQHRVIIFWLMILREAIKQPILFRKSNIHIYACVHVYKCTETENRKKDTFWSEFLG